MPISSSSDFHERVERKNLGSSRGRCEQQIPRFARNDKLENLFLNLAQHETKALKLFVAELLSQTRQGITAFPPGIETTLQGPDAGDAVTA
jgi:hypothetical protein